METGTLNFNIKQEGNSLLLSLVGANTKKAREEFTKEIKAIGAKETERLRNIRADQLAGIKKWKDLLSKDVIFNAEKQIEDMYKAQSKALTDTVAAKVKSVESGN